MNSMLIRRDENDALGTRLVPYTRGLRSLLYTMIGTGLMTFGFAVPITYSSVKGVRNAPWKSRERSGRSQRHAG